MIIENKIKENNIKKDEDIEMVDINASIVELRKKFLEIRDMGYVKSIRNGSTGVGATFEALLGKKEDKLELPDFKGIEIKTKRAYSKSLINLFNAGPKGETEFELKRIRDKYGYPDKIDKKLKRFAAHIVANEMVKVGLFYKFKIKVDREKERVILCIYDWNDVCIDDSSYWEFSVLKEKLFRKLNVFAKVLAWTNKIDGVESFKYYKMNIYILKDFDFFLKALEDGKIKAVFKVGNHYDKDRYGFVHGHGVGFGIADEDLDSIFDIYR